MIPLFNRISIKLIFGMLILSIVGLIGMGLITYIGYETIKYMSNFSYNQSSIYIETEAIGRMLSESKLLALKCDSEFQQIIKETTFLAKQAEKLQNNENIVLKYKNLFNPNDYYVESRGAFVSKKPKNIKDCSTIWVPNTVTIDDAMKKHIGLTKYLDNIYQIIKENNPRIERLVTYYENGLVRIYPWEDPVKFMPSGSYDSRKSPIYISLKSNPKKIIWSDPYYDVGGKGWMITCFVKLFDKNNRIIGFHSEDITLNSIVKNIIGTKLYNTGYAFLMNEKANLLALPQRAEKDLLVTYEGKIKTKKEIEQGKITLAFNLLKHPNKKFTSLIKRAIKGETIIDKIIFNEEKYITFYPVGTTGWSVAIVVPASEILSSLNKMQKSLTAKTIDIKEKNMFIFITIILLSLLLCSFIFVWITKMITKPIRKLYHGANLIQKGQLDLYIDINSNDEIGELAKSFNYMASELNKYISSLEEKVKERTEELELANKKLLKASQAKSDFLAAMSHELRTPLNAIIGFSELLKDGLLGELKEEQKKPIEEIFKSGKHLLTLINDILDLSKIEASKVELHFEDVDISELLLESLNIVAERAMRHNITLNSYIEKDIGIVKIDPVRIKQIVYNLLSNAVKFTPDDGTVTLSSKLVTLEDVLKYKDYPGFLDFPRNLTKYKKFIAISVKDTGIGIPEDKKDRLFKTFEQLHNTTLYKVEGTGLGLSLVKKLTELHGGTVIAESEENKGSTFIVFIPFIPVKALGNS